MATKGGELRFQLIDIYATDLDIQTSDEGDDEDIVTPRRYVIKLFGRSAKGTTVSVNVTDFRPYFYAKLPRDISQREAEFLIQDLLEEKLRGMRPHISRIDLIRSKDVWGFTNDRAFPFLRFEVYNLETFRNLQRTVERGIVYYGLGRKSLRLYEGNIDPVLRFLHLQKIQPTGWVRIGAGAWTREEDILPTTCQIQAHASSWQRVAGWVTDQTAPFVLASFDLECTSSHGDFPVPRKDYIKTARELYDLYKTLRATKGLTTLEFRRRICDALVSVLAPEGQQSERMSRVYTKKARVAVEPLATLVREHAADILGILEGRIRFRDDVSLPEGSRGSAGDSSDEDTPDDGADPTSDTDDVDIGDLQAQAIAEGDTNAIAALMRGRVTLHSPDVIIQQMTEWLGHHFPALQGDPIIQIGCVSQTYGARDYRRVLFSLGGCSDVPGATVVPCATERELLLAWRQWMHDTDPDVLFGYNIYGFDMNYLYERARELGCDEEFMMLGRLVDTPAHYEEKNLSSSALGDNILKMIVMEGRVSFDVMKVIQRDHKLDSYKLDTVAGEFMKGAIARVDGPRLTVKQTTGIQVGNFLKLAGSAEKHRVVAMDGLVVTVDPAPALTPSSWGLAKDDIHPKQIFECQRGSDDDRAVIAKYCIQDCQLCNHLVEMLSILANNMGMANVCWVPLSFIFLRGQGIKTLSLVSKQCMEDGYLIPVQRPARPPPGSKEAEELEEDGYEGAIVLDPVPGIYVDDPISVLDYASLYPSSMISENISHDMIVLDKAYDNLPGFTYVDVTYDLYEGKGDAKHKVGERICRFAQPAGGRKGVIPRILQTLLAQRKATRKKMEEEIITLHDGTTHRGLVSEDAEGAALVIKPAPGAPATQTPVRVAMADVASRADAYTDFQKAVLDGLQLAYKVTANSAYGQMGARTSALYFKDIAACTTAVGRSMILKAKAFLEAEFNARIVYGDTDSLFCVFDNRDPATGTPLRGLAALPASIENGQRASAAFKPLLKAPHDLEYEKTFYPFIIFSKKRYVGHLYEFDPAKYKQKSMGIVLKRRDNAQIVKTVYGGILDILLKERDVPKSITFLKDTLTRLIDGQFPIDVLVISKTLKSHYKDPTRIAHKVLADRMRDRDPGSAPQTNDRIPYVYIRTKTKVALQGDRIEHPAYIAAAGLEPDYTFYITNQIMKPVAQIYALVLDQLPGYKRPRDHWNAKWRAYVAEGKTEARAHKLIANAKCKEAETVLFQPILQTLKHRETGQTQMTAYFKMEAAPVSTRTASVPLATPTPTPAPAPVSTAPATKKASATTAAAPKKKKKTGLNLELLARPDPPMTSAAAARRIEEFFVPVI